MHPSYLNFKNSTSAQVWRKLTIEFLLIKKTKEIILFFTFIIFASNKLVYSEEKQNKKFETKSTSQNEIFRDVRIGESLNTLKSKKFLIKMDDSKSGTTAYSVNNNKKELSTDFVAVDNSTKTVVEITHICDTKSYYYDTPASLNDIGCLDSGEKITQKFKGQTIYKLCLLSKDNKRDIESSQSTVFIIPAFNSAFMLMNNNVFSMSLGQTSRFMNDYSNWTPCGGR